MPKVLAKKSSNILIGILPAKNCRLCNCYLVFVRRRTDGIDYLMNLSDCTAQYGKKKSPPGSECHKLRLAFIGLGMIIGICRLKFARGY